MHLGVSDLSVKWKDWTTWPTNYFYYLLICKSCICISWYNLQVLFHTIVFLPNKYLSNSVYLHFQLPTLTSSLICFLAVLYPLILVSIQSNPYKHMILKQRFDYVKLQFKSPQWLPIAFRGENALQDNLQGLTWQPQATAPVSTLTAILSPYHNTPSTWSSFDFKNSRNSFLFCLLHMLFPLPDTFSSLQVIIFSSLEFQLKHFLKYHLHRQTSPNVSTKIITPFYHWFLSQHLVYFLHWPNKNL